MSQVLATYLARITVRLPDGVDEAPGGLEAPTITIVEETVSYALAEVIEIAAGGLVPVVNVTAERTDV